MINRTEQEKAILRGIGDYYVDKNMKDVKEKYPFLFEAMPKTEEQPLQEALIEYDKAFNKAYEDVKNLHVSNLTYDTETGIIEILLHRPGLFIGERGKNIEALVAYLKENVYKTIKKIHITEDNLDNYLLPINYSDDGGYDYE